MEKLRKLMENYNEISSNRCYHARTYRMCRETMENIRINASKQN